MTSVKSSDRKLKKRQQKDRQRILRVVEYLDYSAVFDHSPVEVIGGYVVSDVTDYSIFSSFVFRSVSKKRIKALDVRLFCYHNQNIPYLKIPFTYSFDRYTFGTRREGKVRIRDKKKLSDPCINYGESFGEAVYIPIPESYFTRFELEVTGVRYADGTYEELGLIAGKRQKTFGALDDDRKFAYLNLNVFVAAEETFPTRFLPQKGEFAWLCCCGNKNPNELDKCDLCMRERDWQLENATEERLAAEAAKLKEDETAYAAHDKAKYSQIKYLETEQEIQNKIKAYELAMKKVAQEERRAQRRKTWLIPTIIACLAATYLFVFLLKLIFDV